MPVSVAVIGRAARPIKCQIDRCRWIDRLRNDVPSPAEPRLALRMHAERDALGIALGLIRRVQQIGKPEHAALGHSEKSEQESSWTEAFAPSNPQRKQEQVNEEVDVELRTPVQSQHIRNEDHGPVESAGFVHGDPDRDAEDEYGGHHQECSKRRHSLLTVSRFRACGCGGSIRRAGAPRNAGLHQYRADQECDKPRRSAEPRTPRLQRRGNTHNVHYVGAAAEFTFDLLARIQLYAVKPTESS